MAREGRGLFRAVWNNFVSSLKPRQIQGNLIGKDHFGNEYFEIPPDPSRGKRNPSRWFLPKGGENNNFDREVPTEWQAWLRGRRAEPPSPDEIAANLAIIEMKQKNAALLEQKFPRAPPPELGKEVKGVDSFPKYDDFEDVPGRKPKPR
jgi:NADH dehydrogenase [ubiquinone] 1 alpha subcomplex assembly factor 2